MRSQIMCVAVLLAAVLSVPALAEWTWTTPVPVTAGINTQLNEWTPYLSYDGLSLYFSRGYINGKFNIYEAKRSQPSGDFTSVSQVLSASGHAISPWVSPDNLRMYYHQELANFWQIKVSQRASVNDPWSQGAVVSGLPSSNICLPSLSSDELTIVFNNPNVGGWDMYMATRPSKDSAFGNIRSLSELNTAGFDSRPFLSPDALSIYWSIMDLGQIFEATRQSVNDPFGNIQHLSAFDIPGGYSAHPDIAISSDGTAFYFVGGGAGMPAADIYVSYLVPEPATLLLMSIGGVLLRKLKK